MKRRDFLQTSGLALGSLAFANASAFGIPRAGHPIGLQLYTVFGLIDKDVPGVLKKIADTGYREIESAYSFKGGYYGMKPKEFKKLLADLGMVWTSNHVLGAPFKMPAGAKPMLDADGKPLVFPPAPNLRENMQQVVDDMAEGGVPYLVCANTPTATTDELKASIATLNKTADACKKAGIDFCYHNHDMEFKPVDGKLPYDILLAETDASGMKMELDLCWVTKAGVDPVALFKKNPGRFPLWHVKDLDKQRVGPAPVGDGVVDFKPVFEHAAEAGMKHFFVEHDSPKDPFASIATSFNYLTNTLHV